MGDPLGFIGGTGPEGLGLALRLAAAGEPLLLGSRERTRAQDAAARVRAVVPGAIVHAADNDGVLTASSRIILTFPAAALPAFLDASAARLGGKLVIDVLVPLAVGHDVFFDVAPVPGARSAGELIQQRSPTARVVSAFKNLSAEHLRDLTTQLEGDVLLAGDDADARAEVAGLVRRLPGLRAVDAGRLANARFIEAITP